MVLEIGAWDECLGVFVDGCFEMGVLGWVSEIDCEDQMS